MSSTLSIVLNSSGLDYKDLFKPGKVLEKRGGVWKLTCRRISEREKAFYFSELMSHLYHESSLDGVNAEALAFKINEFVFKTALRSPAASVIDFKSSSDSYSFLSNFTPSAIFVNRRFFPHAELAYQFLISCEIDGRAARLEFHKIPSSPLDAKKIGAKIQRISGKILGREAIDRLKVKKLQLMKDVVEAKFSQNPYLREALIATGSSELREDTTDSLFAGKDGCENGLGRILHELRDVIASGSAS
jgi:predicted NAD-dependent protein-ADP-ribosyltransferase YbiA (DUF1768 family)